MTAENKTGLVFFLCCATESLGIAAIHPSIFVALYRRARSSVRVGFGNFVLWDVKASTAAASACILWKLVISVAGSLRSSAEPCNPRDPCTHTRDSGFATLAAYSLGDCLMAASLAWRSQALGDWAAHTHTGILAPRDNIVKAPSEARDRGTRTRRSIAIVHIWLGAVEAAGYRQVTAGEKNTAARSTPVLC